MDSTQELLRDIERFVKRHGISEPTFGRKAASNSNLIRSMRAGASPTLKTADRIRAYMEGYKG